MVFRFWRRLGNFEATNRCPITSGTGTDRGGTNGTNERKDSALFTRLGRRLRSIEAVHLPVPARDDRSLLRAARHAEAFWSVWCGDDRAIHGRLRPHGTVLGASGLG